MLQTGNYPLQNFDVIAGIRQFPQNSEKKIKIKDENNLKLNGYLTTVNTWLMRPMFRMLTCLNQLRTRNVAW